LLPRVDIETLYEGLYLSVFTRFEVLLEQLFFGLITGRIDRLSCGAAPRIGIASDRVAREIVLRERSYIDWLPYKKTEDLARAFLSSGRPFTKLDNGDKSRLATLLVIRHAIAHKSGHAKKTFAEKVLGSTPLPPRERTPAGFLRSQYRITPAQTRFELYMQQMRSIARTITH
jgi:hypothetical protein